MPVDESSRPSSRVVNASAAAADTTTSEPKIDSKLLEHEFAQKDSSGNWVNLSRVAQRWRERNKLQVYEHFVTDENGKVVINQKTGEPLYKSELPGGFWYKNNDRQCTGKSRNTGLRCRLPAIRGKTKCKIHGGRNSVSTGRYSEFISSTLQRFLLQVSTIDRTKLDAELEILRVIVGRTTELYSAAVEYTQRTKDTTMESSMMKMLQRSIAHVRDTIEAMHRINTQNVISPDSLVMLLRGVVSVIRTYVPSDRIESVKEELLGLPWNDFTKVDIDVLGSGGLNPAKRVVSPEEKLTLLTPRQIEIQKELLEIEMKENQLNLDEQIKVFEEEKEYQESHPIRKESNKIYTEKDSLGVFENLPEQEVAGINDEDLPPLKPIPPKKATQPKSTTQPKLIKKQLPQPPAKQASKSAKPAKSSPFNY